MTEERRALGGSCGCSACPPGEFRIWHQSPATLTTGLAAATFLLAAAAGIIYGEVSWAFYAGALFLAGWHLVPRALRAVRRLRLDMNILVLIAALGAGVLGEWMEAALVVLLLSVSETLERVNMDRTRGALRRLMDMVPSTARILTSSGEAEVPLPDIQVGARVMVRPGERIPLDGQVLAGSSYVNQAPITGESIPVSKGPGDAVFAGTLNQEGLLEFETTRPHHDTTLARIVQLVDQAASRGDASERLADRFAAYYTPGVLLLALVVWVAGPLVTGDPSGLWLYRALALILVACPCALVLSAPSAVISGLSRAARAGILVKSGSVLEQVGTADTILFDKTGTLTSGQLRVEAIRGLGSTTPEEVLLWAATAEYGSGHPISQAIMREASARGIEPLGLLSFESVPGLGVKASTERDQVLVGRPSWVAHASGFPLEELERSAGGRTIILVAVNGQVKGEVEVSDTLRPQARAALEELRRLGVSTLAMVTGDSTEVAADVAGNLGLDWWQGECLPEDKVDLVRKSQGKEHVMVVGDGINDAPALAAAHTGIAMGRGGTDVALETADVALMSDDLGKIPLLISLSRSVRSVVRQNIVLAVGLKALALIAAALGHLTLWMAVLADTGVTFLVVSNGLRILGWRRPSVRP